MRFTSEQRLDDGVLEREFILGEIPGSAIDAPGCGDRPRSAADEQARADLRRAMQAGEPVDEVFESFIGPAGHHSAAVPAAVGRRGEPPAAGPGPVRRLRHQGEDAARQYGRAHRNPVVRGRRREPVLRPAPEVRPGRRADSRRWTVSARTPLIEDRSRPSSMAVAGKCTTAPIAAVPVKLAVCVPMT